MVSSTQDAAHGGWQCNSTRDVELLIYHTAAALYDDDCQFRERNIAVDQRTVLGPPARASPSKVARFVLCSAMIEQHPYRGTITIILGPLQPAHCQSPVHYDAACSSMEAI